MTIEELLKVLEMQEEILQFSHFTHGDAWELGNDDRNGGPKAEYAGGAEDPDEQRTDDLSVRV